MNLVAVTCGFRWQVLLAQSSRAPRIHICPYCMGWWAELPATRFHSVSPLPSMSVQCAKNPICSHFVGKPSEGLAKDQNLTRTTKDQQGMFWIQASLRNWMVFAESLGKKLRESWLSETVVVCASAADSGWGTRSRLMRAASTRTASNLCGTIQNM